MANTIGWGQGSANNTNQWGRGATNNSISWGSIYNLSPSGETNIIGGLQPTFELKYDLITTDFTFTRASFGTRVNEFGLIETVTDLGSDLIQNGSFDELGSERVINGDFENGENDWNFGGDWTLVNGTAEILTSTQSYLRSDNDRIPLTVKTYKLQYEVVTTNGNNFRLAGGSSAFGTVTLDSATVGVKTVCLTSNGTQAYLQFNQNAFRGSIDNISVKQVDPNDDWSKLNSTISDGKGNLDGDGQTSLLWQDILTDTKTYQATFTVSDYNGLGEARIVNNNGSPIYTVTSNGTFTINFTHNVASGNFLFRARTGAIFSVDNVSVQEVLEDDVPRIDYTGSTFDVPVLGSELIVNGTFDTDSNWTKQSGWSIANGVATFDSDNYVSGNTNLYQSCMVSGKEYVLTYDVVDYVEGVVKNASRNGQIERTANGTYTEQFVATNANLFMNASNNGTVPTKLKIDNVSVKEVTAYTTTDKGAFLLEPISTNLLTYSEDFTQWSGISATLINSSSETNPSNINNVGLITGNSGTTSKFATLPVSTTSSKHTYSVFLKYNGHQFIQFASGGSTEYGNFDIQNGIVGSGSAGTTLTIESFNNDWYRCVLNTSASITPTNIAIALVDSATSSRLSSTSSVDSVYAWGAQLEALSYATSYIPTNGTTVTRAQETCLDGVVSANSLEGVFYWEGSSEADSTTIIAELSQGNIINRIALFYKNGNDGQGNIRINNIQTGLTGGGSLINNTKLAVVWGNNIVSFWSNGVQVDTDTYVGSIPEGVLTALNFAQVGGAVPLIGRTKDLRIYDKALTDDELINLTTI